MTLFKKKQKYTITTRKEMNFAVQNFAEEVSVKDEPINVHSYGSIIAVSFYSKENDRRIFEKLTNSLSDDYLVIKRQSSIFVLKH
jgi:hypothetical protein